MRCFAGFLFLLLCLFSCNSKDDVIVAPERLIDPEQMAEVIVDINLVEAQLTEIQFLQSLVKDSVRSYYSGLFLKHNITQEQLNENLQYYVSRGAIMDSIYDNAINMLSEMEKGLEHVKMPDNDMTHVSREEMEMLLTEPVIYRLCQNEDIVFPIKHDSIMRYYKIHSSVLDSMGLTFRRFGVSLNFYAGSQNKMNRFFQSQKKVSL